MSRSNPTNDSPNPCTRWFEWDGSKGCLRYYDKVNKQQVEMENDFSFILLDETATVKGWHDASESGIYSNEVRDTRVSPFIVKAFKGGVLAEGLYSHVRDKIANLGGHFTSNVYIAYKPDNGELKLGALQFKGAALGAWMEFRKQNRSKLFKEAVNLNDIKEGKKGKVVFKVPVFRLVPLGEESNKAAIALDVELQSYLDAYFKRTNADRAETHEQIQTQDPAIQPDANYEPEPEPGDPALREPVPTESDDVPF